jgi:hypothetical protein
MAEASLHKPKLRLITPRQWGGGRVALGGIGFVFALPTQRPADPSDPQARPYQPLNDNHATYSPTPAA